MRKNKAMTTININRSTYNKDIVIEIGKFTILWNMFEKEKCENDCNVDKLAQIVKDKKTNQYWKNLAEVLKNRLDARACEIDSYLNSYLSHGRGMKEIEKACVKEFICSGGEGCLVGGLIAVYRIRNNMFHGLKDYAYFNDQLELFRGINKFLEKSINDL